MNKVAEVKNVLKANGVTVTDAQAEAIVAKYDTNKKELDAASLDKVTGGVDPATITLITTLAPTIIDLVKQLFGGGGDKKDGGGDDKPAETYDQNNENNSGNQVATQKGNITAGNLSM